MLDKAECKRQGLPWPLMECITGNGEYEPHDEERFDFPCSTTWRDFYMNRPVERQTETVIEHSVSDERYEELKEMISRLKPQKRAGGVIV